MLHRHTMLLVLMVFMVISPLSFFRTPALAASQERPAPQQTPSGPIGLPRGCGSVTPPSGVTPTCCMSGVVWLDGKAVRGAVVTVAMSDGRSLSTTTDSGADSSLPFFRLPLSGGILDAKPGDVVTVTASYGGHTQSITYEVRSGGQQVDIVLAKRQAEDYITGAAIGATPPVGFFKGMSDVALGASGALFSVDQDLDRVQVMEPDSTWRGWGETGTLPGQLRSPTGVAVDGLENVYVVDNGNSRVQKFSRQGVWITGWGSPGKAPGQFTNPTGIAVDTAGFIYVVDSDLEEIGGGFLDWQFRVQKFRGDGTYVATYRPQAAKSAASLTGVYVPDADIEVGPGGDIVVSFGEELFRLGADGSLQKRWVGVSNDQYSFDSTGVGVGPDGTVYVADGANSRIHAFTMDGATLRTWTISGAGKGIAVAQDGTVYVAGRTEARLFTSQGRPVRSLGRGATPAPGSMYSPQSVVVAPDGDVYALDYANDARVLHWSSDGSLLESWSVGTYYAEGLAVTANGEVLVVDSRKNRVLHFSSGGALLGSWGSQGSGNGQFQTPSAVAAGPDSSLYVVDKGNHRIQKFSADGTWLLSFGGLGSAPGQLNTPEGIAIDAVGNVYVADSWNNRIQKFSAGGVPLAVIGAGIFWYVHGVAVAPDGEIAAADIGYDRIARFAPNGAFLGTWGDQSTGAARLNDPHSLAFDRSGSLIVADAENVRIARFSRTGAFERAWEREELPAGRLYGASQIWMTPQQELAVVDTSNNRLQFFSTAGQWRSMWGRYGNREADLYFPRVAAQAPDGRVHILRRTVSSQWVQVLNSDGSYFSAWGELGTGDGQLNRVVDMAVGPNGLVYTLEDQPARVQVFEVTGLWPVAWQHLRSIPLAPAPGDQNFQLQSIAVDTQGRVIVGIEANYLGRILALSSQGTPLASWTINDDPLDIAIGEQDTIYISGREDIVKLSAAGQPRFAIAHELDWAPALTVDRRDRSVFLVDSYKDIIRAYAPMTYTRPIATFSWVQDRDLVQSDETLRIIARAADSDEDGSPAQFGYRWFINGQMLADVTGPELTRAATALPLGSVTVGLEVVDDEGEISPRLTTQVEVSRPPGAAWTFMLYLVAESKLDGAELLDAMDTGFNSGLLYRLARQQQQQPNSNVNVVAQIDSFGGPTRRLVLDPSGTWKPVAGVTGELAMDDPDTLRDFVTWARREYPATFTYLAIASHGNGYQGVAWDDTSGEGAYLSAAELRQALDNAGATADLIDVVHLDACSMGLLDVAYELRTVAGYVVASQNLGWSFFLQDEYRKTVGANTTPRQLGTSIVDIYANYAERESTLPASKEQFPYTIALLDLQRAQRAAQELDALSRSLGGFAALSTNTRGVLSEVRSASQRFDSQEFYNITETDEYVDAVNWAERLIADERINDQAIKDDAGDFINALRGSNPLVVAGAQRNSGDRFKMPERYDKRVPRVETRLSGANGVSLYYPTGGSASVTTPIWDDYKNNRRFQLAADTQWNEFLRVGNSSLPTGGSLTPEPGKPETAIPRPRMSVYLPAVRR